MSDMQLLRASAVGESWTGEAFVHAHRKQKGNLCEKRVHGYYQKLGEAR